MQITVKSNIEKIIKQIDDIAKKQLPFAIAKALTMTAQDVQGAIVGTLPEKFTLRTGWWKPSNKYGFKIKAATKSNLQSEIFTIAPWMTLHEEGGIKKPFRKFLAIPTIAVKRTKRDLIRESQKPRALKKAFIITIKSGQKILVKRISKKKLTTMYVMEPRATIKPVLDFYRTGKIIANARFKINFAQAFEEALKTAK